MRHDALKLDWSPAHFSLSYTGPESLRRESSGVAAALSDGPSCGDCFLAIGCGRRPARASRHFKPNVRQAGPPRLCPVPPCFHWSGDIGWRHQISARTLIFNQRRRVRAQNAATPRRSSVPVYPGGHRPAGRSACPQSARDNPAQNLTRAAAQRPAWGIKRDVGQH